MKKLLSLPPHLVDCFHELTNYDKDDFFCSCDPVDHRLGSGGGTMWLLDKCYQASDDDIGFCEWLSKEKRIIIHAGGHSRRLPSYAPSGKVLTPIPVCRWQRGQRIGQKLLDLQLPLYEQMMGVVDDDVHTMVVSGDVYIRTTQKLPPIPHADVVCYGIWLDASIAKNHGVFLCERETPEVLTTMLQKPSVSTLKQLEDRHLYLTDIGVWFLSDRAVDLLNKRSHDENGNFIEYDLYSQFGRALGSKPAIENKDINSLSVAVIPLDGGEFYHFGTSREMISSTLAIQNIMNDQRLIMHHDLKPHPSIFVQNSITEIQFKEDNTNIWIENSHIPSTWTISSDNVITGVPENQWSLSFNPGQCLDIVPIDEDLFAVRTYNIDDRFDGIKQQEKMFPVVSAINLKEAVYAMMSNASLNHVEVKCMVSADDLMNEANLFRLFDQRKIYQLHNCMMLAENWRHSVFYQTDLNDMFGLFNDNKLPMPEPLPDSAPQMLRIHDAMFRGDSDKAFGLLCDSITSPVIAKCQLPRLSAQPDQIIWGRSPVRIDIAGGWTDTPPYCLMEGGNVINFAINLNGQQPLQVYIRPCLERHILFRSIDMGANELITCYDEIADFNVVGSPFSIPKAALYLAGFHPDTCEVKYDSLEAQLEEFGSGFELTLFSAVPSGSGLGTSSILAATVLGAINEFCTLSWDKHEICQRTFVLEQLLTTGGGWQDQFGGVMSGVKMLQTKSGFLQRPVVKWLPDHVFTDPENAMCHLLYYTGVRRTAKDILAEIVRRMFLNENSQLQLLRQMKDHTLSMYEALQQQDFKSVGTLMRQTWIQNQTIDSGTNPPEVKEITCLIDDLCLGYKLPGAGGGGYLYMMAKDPEAAVRIKHILNNNRKNPNARFVDMTLSRSGLEITRS